MARVGIFVCGVLLSLTYSGGLLYLTWAFILRMADEAGRNISMGQIFFALFLVLALVIIIPGGHVYFYKKFRREGHPILAKGLISGFFVLLAGFGAFYLNEHLERERALAPHSEEYLNFQRQLLLEQERKRIADSLEWENYYIKEYSRHDSLKKAMDSIRQEKKNEKDWRNLNR